VVPGAPLSLASLEKQHILAVLDACGGNKSEAARKLEVSRKTLDRKLQQWGQSRDRD
jgi:DNA-binding NtrC family response regulator